MSSEPVYALVRSSLAVNSLETVSAGPRPRPRAYGAGRAESPPAPVSGGVRRSAGTLGEKNQKRNIQTVYKHMIAGQQGNRPTPLVTKNRQGRGVGFLQSVGAVYEMAVSQNLLVCNRAGAPLTRQSM